MAQLILIRHSISKPTADTSAHKWNLTDKGRARCEKLAVYLQAHQPRIIYSSAEPKARTTAELVAAHLMIPSAVAVDLHETRRDHVPFFEDVADWQQALLKGFEQPDKVVFGEESFNAARGRFARQIDSLLTAHPGETIAAVTHGTVMSLYLADHVMTHEVVSQTGLTPIDAARIVWQGWGMPGYVVLSLPDMHIVELVPGINDD